MAQLLNKTNGLQIASSVEVADGFFARLVGLLGRAGMRSKSALWIKRCDSIHTFFMRFTIDVVFVDRDMVVKRTYAALRPWRATLPSFRAWSVFELPAGTLASTPVSIGDRLYVGD